jgi:hypothetical protein
LGNAQSIFLTRASLLNLLADVGFTSVVEVRHPVVPLVDDLVDSVMLAALRGRPIVFRSFPSLDELATTWRRSDRRAPAWIAAVADPQQGLYWRVRERLTHDWIRAAFRSRRSLDAWRRDSP